MSSTDEVTADECALGAERQILLDVGAWESSSKQLSTSFSV